MSESANQVIEIQSDAEYQSIVQGNPGRLVVVDFSASWCGPCRGIAPLYHQLPGEYPGVLFLKVDVDECDETAKLERISAMPTFLFKRDGATVDMVRGANSGNLRGALDKQATAVAVAAGAAQSVPPSSAAASAGVVHVHSDAEYEAQIDAASGRLVVVDFSATWCGPCRGIAPFFDELARNNPEAVFLKVDVDECPDTAGKESVRAMPTFLFFRDGIRCDDLQGAKREELAHKVELFARLQPGQVAAKYQEYQQAQNQVQ